MKKFLSSIFVAITAVCGMFFASVSFSNSNKSENLAAAASTYDTTILNAFSDNENLSVLVNENIELGTNFNVLDHINLELYDQNPYGSCYATSLAQVLNLCYEYQTEEHIKLSAIALALQIEDLFFNYGSNDVTILENSFDFSYVSEYDFPYELANVYNEKLYSTADVVDLDFEGKEIIDVKEYYSFPYYTQVASSSESVQEQYLTTIKKAIKKQGALGIGLEYKVGLNGSYYIYDATYKNRGGHAMVLVGYDDNFSASNFVTNPSSDGAFIILNSWGVEEELIYLSYESVYSLQYIFGVGGFVDPDERAEEISNIDKSFYSIIDNFQTFSSSSDLEIGYQLSNTTENGYLSQIDLQPVTNTYSTNYYNKSIDIELYLNKTSSDIDEANIYLGAFDINSGTNKIVLDEPIAVGEEFALKIVVTDSSFSYGFFDRSSQNFNALFKQNGTWQTASMSNDNYNLVRTPFYLKAITTDENQFEISHEQNYQTFTTNEVVFELSSSNAVISDVDVQIYKHGVANAKFSSFELSNVLANDLFNINATTSSVSISQKEFAHGTFKVVISLNGGEKQFIKFLCFDDGIKLNTLVVDPIPTLSGTGYYFRLYQSSFEADEINVTIPSFYEIQYTQDYGTALRIKKVFLGDYTNVTFTHSYSVDSSSRITKATVVFTNTKLQSERTIVVNFSYESLSQIIYVTALPNATHSNTEFVATGSKLTLKDATAPNHNFLGWYEDATFSGSRVSAITSNYDGQIIFLYAKFEQKTISNFAKSVSYDEDTNLLSVVLDFSDYNLGIYDTIEFSNITHKFLATTTAKSFTITKTNSYLYQVYVDKSDMATINTIGFDILIKRYDFYNGAVTVLAKYDGANPMWVENSVIDGAVEVNDVIKITLSSSGSGIVYNALTGVNLSSGDYYVEYGGDFYLRFVPNDKYFISSLKVNGTSVSISETYSFENLTANATIDVVFTLRTFEIWMIVNGEGSVDRALKETVVVGESIAYNFTASEGYYLAFVEIDGKTYTNISSYIFENVNENHNIIVNFETYEFIITATITGKGTIGQFLEAYVSYGESLTYTFVASEGYTLKQVLLDGTPVAIVSNAYTLSNITADHSLEVIFAKDIINISVEIVGAGSVVVLNSTSSETIKSLSETEAFTVEYNTSLKFLFETITSHETSELYVNGTKITVQNEISRSNLNEDISIKVVFKIKTYTIEVKVNGSGSINHPLKTTVSHGEDVNYVFTASTGYYIQSLMVNNVSVATSGTYLISDIQTDYQIVVNFEIQTYTISWYNYNGSLITTTSVNYSVTPVATFVTPTRAAEGIYVYEFSGWNTKADGTGIGLAAATKNTNYYAQFISRLVRYEIKASSSSGGFISPSGSHMVDHGTNQTFLFLADAGYHLSRVFVDGKIVEFIDEYTFENVTKAHTISATFKRNDYKATIINNDEKGEIIGSVWLESGERAAYKIVTQKGYKVERVLVNGNEVTVTNNIFIVESVSSDFNIIVEYTSNSSQIIEYLKDNVIIVAVAAGAIVVIGGASVAVKISHKRKKQAEYDV